MTEPYHEKRLRDREDSKRKEAELHAKMRTHQCEAAVVMDEGQPATRCLRLAVGEVNGMMLCRYHLDLVAEQASVKHFKTAE